MRIIRCKDLAAQLNVSVSTLWRWRRKALIPEPIYFSSRTIGWDEKIINDWINRLNEKSSKKLKFNRT